MGDLIQFVPRSTLKSDRAFWKGPDSLELAALEFEIVNQVFGTTTPSAEETPVRLSDNGE